MNIKQGFKYKHSFQIQGFKYKQIQCISSVYLCITSLHNCVPSLHSRLFQSGLIPTPHYWSLVCLQIFNQGTGSYQQLLHFLISSTHSWVLECTLFFLLLPSFLLYLLPTSYHCHTNTSVFGLHLNNILFLKNKNSPAFNHK